MAVTTERPTLGQYVAQEWMQPFLKKRLLGGYWTNLGACMYLVSPRLFERGAVLGRARADHLDILERMLVVNGKDYDGRHKFFCRELRKTTQKRAYGCVEAAEDLESFWLTFGFPQQDLRDSSTRDRLLAADVRLGRVLPLLTLWHLDGITFGATCPELFELLWMQGHDTTEGRLRLARAYKAIVSFQGREFDPVEFQQLESRLDLPSVEQSVLVEVARYAEEFCPEFIDSLGLRMAEA